MRTGKGRRSRVDFRKRLSAVPEAAIFLGSSGKAPTGGSHPGGPTTSPPAALPLWSPWTEELFVTNLLILFLSPVQELDSTKVLKSLSTCQNLGPALETELSGIFKLPQEQRMLAITP